MAADDSSDLFMMFELPTGKLYGESGTDLVPSNSRLLKGFEKNKIIEIDSFSFAVGINDGTTKQGQGQGAPPGQQTAYPPGHSPGTTGAQTGAAVDSTPSFEAWREGLPHNKYPVSVQPITFTRGIDRSSMELLRCCIKSVSFKSATLVKRRAVGGPASGEVFLRMDFDGVLITDIAWSNSDPVKETCRFISRAITVAYRPQLPTGKLGAPKYGFWSMLPWEQEVRL